MKELIDSLKVFLADAVTMKFTAHGYHWNVEGPDFSQYHELFGNIYEDVDGSIDPIAEDLRKLDEYAPFTLTDFIELRSVTSEEVTASPKDMAKALLKMNTEILKTIDKTFKLASKANEQGIANFLAERNDMHKKWHWQLSASVK
jgi:starvation-inducible DNA-binding protein